MRGSRRRARSKARKASSENAVALQRGAASSHSLAPRGPPAVVQESRAARWSSVRPASQRTRRKSSIFADKAFCARRTRRLPSPTTRVVRLCRRHRHHGRVPRPTRLDPPRARRAARGRARVHAAYQRCALSHRPAVATALVPTCASRSSSSSSCAFARSATRPQRRRNAR